MEAVMEKSKRLVEKGSLDIVGNALVLTSYHK
jgi:hypothetical protein